eukprot:TRINITY_DN3231_c0_g2_i1.p1 TRINITY_DN3231_c0_g2~~TRINITY_DN3231_c0_g2_i1.p1  ORF type:complete len:310 (-),score=18.20 TRINITY_DN3231_c0_g2_i1:176-1105(-)
MKTGGEWLREYNGASKHVKQLVSSRGGCSQGLQVLRVRQLDALILDEELTEMLKDLLIAAFRHIQPHVFRQQFNDELLFVVQTLLFRYSLYVGKPSPGMQLMNLTYDDNSGQHFKQDFNISKLHRILIFLFQNFGKYAWKKFFQVHNSSPWTWKFQRFVEGGFQVMCVANFCVFLWKGRYRNLVERILGLKLKYSSPPKPQVLSYEFLNRQLVWKELSEFLLVMLPLINTKYLRRRIRKMFMVPPRESKPSSQIACSICGLQNMVMPCCAIPCQHIHCYYCISVNLAVDPEFECQTCGKRVQGVKRCSR